MNADYMYREGDLDPSRLLETLEDYLPIRQTELDVTLRIARVLREIERMQERIEELEATLEMTGLLNEAIEESSRTFLEGLVANA